MALDLWTSMGGQDVLALTAYQYLMGKDSETSCSMNNSSATITYYVAWNVLGDAPGGGNSNVQNFISDVLGYSYIEGTSTIKRILPHAHPDFQYFYAVDAKIDPFNQYPENSIQGGVAYQVAKIVVTYRPLPYAVLADNEIGAPPDELRRFVSRKFGTSGQFLSAAGIMKFVTPAANEGNRVWPTPPGKIVSTMDMEYTWHQVPARFASPFIPPNMSRYVPAVGRVNSEIFDPSALAAPPGTVLFESIDPRLSVPTLGGAMADAVTINGGLYTWDITVKFKYMNNGLYTGPVAGLAAEYAGHNYVWRMYGEGPGVTLPFWDLLAAPDDAGNVSTTHPRIYNNADLNVIFSL